MSEPKAKSSENKSTSSNKTAVDVVTRANNKVEKLKWTLDRCKRFARRYPNESVWASCHSSSYKAAVAHGWKELCLNQSSNSTSSSNSFKSAA